jgi:hypothetical protein
MLLGAANLADGQTPIEIPQREVAAHRISHVHWIRAPGGLFEGLQLHIEVDENGAVTSVKVIEGRGEFREAAVALAKTWRYRPFVRHGWTVPATLSERISVFPPERPVTGNVPFPSVRDWDSLKITLQRTTCYGNCPAYEVQIDGNGDVVFDGKRRRNISREALQALLEVFRKANYFSLDREYRILATDLPTYIVSVSIDGQSMSVEDYGGLQVGMPTSVRDVEDAIDETAGTRDWLKHHR